MGGPKTTQTIARTTVVALILTGLHNIAVMAESKEKFLALKKDILDKEKTLQTGGNLVLDKNETKVNNLFMGIKEKEVKACMKKGAFFPPAEHFFKAKPVIEKSDVFKMIKRMPKGAVLHVHDMAMVDMRWVIQSATYDDNCYMYIQENKQLVLQFYRTPPKDKEWQTVNHMRKEHGNATEFDEWLYKQMTIVVDDPAKVYPTQDDVWEKFQSIFTAFIGVYCYAPVFNNYVYQALKEFYQDNVQFIEIRGLVPQLYDLDGNMYDQAFTVQSYIDVIGQFRKDYPDFLGCKLIMSSLRNVEKSIVLDGIKFTLDMMRKYPDFVVGYDLVGQEDQGYPLEYYLGELLYPSQLNPPVSMPYFFHAGETTWEGTFVDRNLIDALLLNTSRIGHGFALPKHPEALEIARKKDVPIELNPISNQVLQLVADLRDHTASSLLATGSPLVVSCDDPPLWGASGVSYDYYETIMGIAGAEGDLAMLKQLFMDTIKYSAMSQKEKENAKNIWEEKWRAFIEETVKEWKL